MFELSIEVWKFTETPPASRNFKYCDQIRDSSDSAHRNVAEGFGRYNPPEFLRFLDIVKASADETRALLRKGHATGTCRTSNSLRSTSSPSVACRRWHA